MGCKIRSILTPFDSRVGEGIRSMLTPLFNFQHRFWFISGKQTTKRESNGRKPRPMSQIKQLLQLHEQGKGIKFIARSLGISKNTVKAYLAKVTLSPLDIQSLLALDDPIMEARFHAGNPAYKDERFEHLKANLDFFSKELGRVGVTKQLLWEEYRSDYPLGYSRSQFCYHLSQQLIARKPSMVLHSGCIFRPISFSV